MQEIIVVALTATLLNSTLGTLVRLGHRIGGVSAIIVVKIVHFRFFCDLCTFEGIECNSFSFSYFRYEIDNNDGKAFIFLWKKINGYHDF